MIDHVDAIDGARRVRRVAQVAQLEVDSIDDVSEVVAASRGQVVHDPNLMAERQQAIHDVRAYEAGAARDEAARR
jgi:hypothetical protein